MRLTRFIDQQGQLHYGLDLGDGRAELLSDSPLLRPPRATGAVVTMARRLAPVDPTNILCIAGNYWNHCKESGLKNADPYPVPFMKPTGSLQSPGEPIRIPRCTLDGPEVDFEGELAVIIGRDCRNTSESDALDHVLGYTIANDVSARHWQQACRGQYIRGKGFDTFCPLGPVLVTTEQIPDPQALHLITRVNGQVMQEADTSDMMYTVAQLIAFLSQDTTLPAGTVLLTGTPEGVGHFRNPPVYLKSGDVVEITIEPIGTLSNPVTE